MLKFVCCMEFFNPLYGIEYDYPPREPDRVLVVASSPRSGSTFLGALLQQTREMGFPLEYHASANIAQMSGRLEPGDVLHSIIRVRTTPNGVFSLKTHWVKSHFRVLASIIELPRYYVRIRRRDIAAQAASLVRARATGNYLSVAGLKGAAPTEKIDMETAIKTIEKAELGWTNFFRANSLQVVTIWYEDDLLVNPQSAVDRVADFLGVKRAPVDVTNVPTRMQRSE